MLSQRWHLVYQQAVHFLFWHCKYKPDGTGARRVFEHFSCTSNRSHQCDGLPRSFAGWVFMVFGCRFIRSHPGFSASGEASWWSGQHKWWRYITNCFEYKDAVGYVSVSIVRFIGTMCCRSCGVSLREGVCPGHLLLRFILWCFSGSLVFSWRLLVGSLWPGCMLCSRCRVQRVSLK